MLPHIGAEREQISHVENFPKLELNLAGAKMFTEDMTLSF